VTQAPAIPLRNEPDDLPHPAIEYFRFGGPGNPHIWCEGCGIGQIWYYTVTAIQELGLDPNKVVWVGGSGCTGRMCTYWKYDYMHTLHGRPLGFATGIKLANPELTVLCHMGDGETSAIGGNHLIQTARRNADVVAICVNNYTYGMTGGQYSPTTPAGSLSATSKYGLVEEGFDLCDLVAASGATYVARTTTTQPRASINYIKRAIQKKGFGFVEIVAQCPTFYGRSNNLGSDSITMLEWMKKAFVRKSEWDKMSVEERGDMRPWGEFVDTERSETVSALHELARKQREAYRG
jgi:2-oxoglutarate/2-oxoacid ferredoxin oxidoreductase subunit beta